MVKILVALSSLLARGWKLLLLLLLTVSPSHWPLLFLLSFSQDWNQAPRQCWKGEEKWGTWFLLRPKKCHKFSSGSGHAVLPGRGTGLDDLPPWKSTLCFLLLAQVSSGEPGHDPFKSACSLQHKKMGTMLYFFRWAHFSPDRFLSGSWPPTQGKFLRSTLVLTEQNSSNRKGSRAKVFLSSCMPRNWVNTVQG